jgi:lipopolysaccharide heptosyltransferase II
MMDSVIDQRETGAITGTATPAPARILIRSSNWLGDAVMTVPAVAAIKRSNPGSHIAILTRSKLADFWRIVPEVDEVIEISPRDSVFAVARKIRSGFEMALLLPNSMRAALEVYLARIPRRVGSCGKSRSWLLNEIVPAGVKPGPPQHQFLRYLELARFVGATIDESICRVESAFSQTRGRALKDEAHSLKASVRIGLCAGAEYGPAKRWLPERFAEVVNTVSQRRACEWVLLGSTRDEMIGEQIAGQIEDKFSNLIGKTTLAELITTLSGCRLLVTNDTGTMHLASYLGVPTVAIFGSTEPALTGPLGKGHRVLRHHVVCSPCFLRKCPLDFRCMRSVEAGEVVEAVLRMLDE